MGRQQSADLSHLCVAPASSRAAPKGPHCHPLVNFCVSQMKSFCVSQTMTWKNSKFWCEVSEGPKSIALEVGEAAM